ncbi:serine/threonine-protein kinase VRK1 [Rhipicephalus sanguineus]|uniref:serine/threonine-protein kinase VRK1 n=1 Tax=Rhipicephalus sanguineus TaxID=34632 RepID=UPI0018944FE5|nr:serine/threonine-protein kinase VRK1 [Rhipicephalus sanguineus]
MPRFRSPGSHKQNGVKYRFMVAEREHSYEPIPADVKAYSRLLVFDEGRENRVYLLDFGLACRYTQNGKHKEYKEDIRMAQIGTVECTSRDAHVGAHSRRGDMVHLRDNQLLWLCCLLPWEDNLKYPQYVSQGKSTTMEDVPLLLSKCSPHRDIPCELLEFVSFMKFENTPDYKRLKRISEKGVEVPRFKPDGRIFFKTPRTLRCNSFLPKKSVLQEIMLAEHSIGESGGENVVEKPPPAQVTSDYTAPIRKNNRWSPAATKSTSVFEGLFKLEPERTPLKKAVSSLSGRTSSEGSRRNGFCEDRNSMSLDNTTTTMLEMLQRKQALLAQQQEGVRPPGGNGQNHSSISGLRTVPVASVGGALTCISLQPR